LRRYKSHLPKCDIALWIIAARSRAIALDQQYLQQLNRVLPKLVIGLNQIDLIEPLNWVDSTKLPSREQHEAIKVIVQDRRARLVRHARQGEVAVIPYSATRYYNLQSLYLECVRSAPAARRWMFDLIKSFSTADWLQRAKGLSPSEREAFLERQRPANDRIEPAELARLVGRS
jgi:uncharacterized protein